MDCPIFIHFKLVVVLSGDDFSTTRLSIGANFSRQVRCETKITVVTLYRNILVTTALLCTHTVVKVDRNSLLRFLYPVHDPYPVAVRCWMVIDFRKIFIGYSLALCGNVTLLEMLLGQKYRNRRFHNSRKAIAKLKSFQLDGRFTITVTDGNKKINLKINLISQNVQNIQHAF